MKRVFFMISLIFLVAFAGFKSAAEPWLDSDPEGLPEWVKFVTVNDDTGASENEEKTYMVSLYPNTFKTSHELTVTDEYVGIKRYRSFPGGMIARNLTREQVTDLWKDASGYSFTQEEKLYMVGNVYQSEHLRALLINQPMYGCGYVAVRNANGSGYIYKTNDPVEIQEFPDGATVIAGDFEWWYFEELLSTDDIDNIVAGPGVDKASVIVIGNDMLYAVDVLETSVRQVSYEN